MKIEKCKIKIKCDVGGCHNMADKSISFDGVNNQFYLCDECLYKLANEIGKAKGGKNEQARSKK